MKDTLKLLRKIRNFVKPFRCSKGNSEYCCRCKILEFIEELEEQGK